MILSKEALGVILRLFPDITKLESPRLERMVEDSIIYHCSILGEIVV